MHDSGISGYVPTSIRKIRMNIENSYSGKHNVVEDVPQGSVLSCTGFTLGIDGSLSNAPHGVKSIPCVETKKITQ